MTTEQSAQALPSPMGYVCRNDYVRADQAKDVHRESWSPVYSMTNLIEYGDACHQPAAAQLEDVRKLRAALQDAIDTTYSDKYFAEWTALLDATQPKEPTNG